MDTPVYLSFLSFSLSHPVMTWGMCLQKSTSCLWARGTLACPSIWVDTLLVKMTTLLPTVTTRWHSQQHRVRAADVPHPGLGGIARLLRVANMMERKCTPPMAFEFLSFDTLSGAYWVSSSVAQTGVELRALLLRAPKCWNNSCATPHLAWLKFVGVYKYIMKSLFGLRERLSGVLTQLLPKICHRNSGISSEIQLFVWR